jgi:hypothetical protein
MPALRQSNATGFDAAAWHLSWFELLQKTEHLPPVLIGLAAALMRWKG